VNAPQGRTSGRPAVPLRHRALGGWLVALGAWAVGALVFFRDAVFSGFDTVTGDRGDYRLIVFLNEHWWQVWRGDAPWRTPPMFHPVEGVLGYSDTFGLYQVAYVPLRLIGIEPFASLQLTLMALTLLGFGATFAILRRHLDLGLLPSCLLAAVAAFSNNLYVDTGHPQMYAVGFVPAIVLITLEAWTSTRELHRAALGGFGGLLLGLLLWSTFYVGWFAGLLGGAALAMGVAIGSVGGRWADIVAAVRSRATLLAAWGVGFVVGLVPFMATYLPVLSDAPSRSYDDVAALAPRPLDVLNVGRHNLAWGWLVEPVLGGDERLDQLHRAVTLTPVLLAAVAFAGVGLLVIWRRERRMPAVLAAGVAASALTFVTLLLPIQFGFGGGWAWLHRFVPGGDAIRVYGRIEVVNNFVALMAIACWWSVRRPDGVDSPPRWRIGAVAVLAFIAFEQVNATTAFRQLDRTAEVAALAAVPTPPDECEWFAIVDERGRENVYPSIEAILIAQRRGVPTVNGYSGQRPPGWHLETWSADYLDDVDAWARSRDIDGTGCRYELVARRWTPLASVPDD
jgi:hypothetical protein